MIQDRFDTRAPTTGDTLDALPYHYDVPVHVAGLAAGAIRQPSRSMRGRVLTAEPASGLRQLADDIGAIAQPAP